MMTQEKKYDEALERARDLITKQNPPAFNRDLISTVFPELIEDEDERIRKELIELISCMHDADPRKKGWIAWLEKQGEQKTAVYDHKFHVGDIVKSKSQPMLDARKIISIDKDCYWCEDKGCLGFAWEDDYVLVEQKPTDKAEPKFKVGDWVIDNIGNIYQIETAAEIIAEHIFGYTIVGGGYFNYNNNSVRLWTINDAKDGDILTYKNDDVEWILIFKNIMPESIDVPHDVLKYHALFTGTDFYDSGIAGMVSENYDSCFTPATKEQRDLLFQKMKEAGYEWRQEEKKLIKINESKFKVGDWVILNGTVAQILDKQKCGFVGLDIDGKDFFCNYGHTDSMCLWTIADAKDGDVLVTEDYIFIFKYILHGGVHLYCHYNFDDEEFDSDIPDAVIGNIHDKGIHFRPATKEQRDLLFSKMKQAGYEWRQEEKKLIKINEPKFKVGDWVVKQNGESFWNGDCVAQITNITDCGEHWLNINTGCWVEARDIRLWTIADAKDGDVLANTAGCALIIKDNESCVCYIDINGEFCADNNKWLFANFTDNVLAPATKEQRNLLFQKMAEEGYVWDSEKKELKMM